jgi:uncharacterized protein (TIGR04222 family)
MFPFTLNGLWFLVFSGACAVGLLIAYRIYRQSKDGSRVQARISELTNDPYQIAYLGGGDVEAVRVAITNLVDRGLLMFGTQPGTLRTTEKATPELVRRPLDQALIQFFASQSAPHNAHLFSKVRAACAQYRQELTGRGLLLSDAQRRELFIAFIVVLGIIGGIVVARIVQALARGQSNLAFLVIGAIFFAWIAVRIGNKGQLTALGR